MRRDQLEHAICAACQIIGRPEVIVVGSQAILGTFRPTDQRQFAGPPAVRGPWSGSAVGEVGGPVAGSGRNASGRCWFRSSQGLVPVGGLDPGPRVLGGGGGGGDDRFDRDV